MVPQHSTSGNGPLPQSKTFVLGACRGTVAGPLAESLPPALARLPHAAGFAVVKQSTVRTVLSGNAGGTDVHIKLFRSGSLSDRARDAMRGDRGLRESKHLLAAAALGLAVVTPVAYGTCEDDAAGKQSFLVTRSVPNSTRCSFALPKVVLQRVGEMLRHAHDRGFLPGDLHPGNIVIDALGMPWLLDLTSVRHAGEATLHRRAEGLAFFCQELDGGPLDPIAAELLTAYLAAGNPLSAAFSKELSQAACSLRLHMLTSFGRRSSRDCRHTLMGVRRRGVPRWHWHKIGDEERNEQMRRACEAFATAAPPPDKTGRRGAVWLLANLVVKQREQGAARKLFTAMYWLHFANIPQAAPVALRTFDGMGHLFAARIAKSNLRVELQDHSLHGSALLAAAHSLGTAVGRLHAHGLRNRDLKFDNLVRDPVTGAICMVDLDGVQLKRPSDQRGQGRDLGRLLAAFRGAGSPGGIASVMSFARAYQRARKRLLQPATLHRLWQTAGKRAHEWHSAHR
ncbi:MAG: lipopolysaccharide kinase InaA family protein [Planctomycetota bacterium]